MLEESGITLPLGVSVLCKQLPAVFEDAENGLPMLVRPLLVTLKVQHDALLEHTERLTTELAAWHATQVESQRLEKIAGVGH